MLTNYLLIKCLRTNNKNINNLKNTTLSFSFQVSAIILNITHTNTLMLLCEHTTTTSNNKQNKTKNKIK